MELRRSCKFVLPKEMSPFFLWIGKNIRKRTASTNFVDHLIVTLSKIQKLENALTPLFIPVINNKIADLPIPFLRIQ